MSEGAPEGGGFDGWGDAGSEPDDATDFEPGSGDDPVEVPDEDIVDEGYPGGQAPGDEPGEVEADGSWGSDWEGAPPSPEGREMEPHKVTDDPSQWGWGTPAPADPAPERPDVKQGAWKPPDTERGGGAPNLKGGTKSKNPFRRQPKGTGGGGSGGVHIHLLTMNPTLRVGGGSKTTTVGGVVLPPSKGGGRRGGGPMTRAARRGK